MQGSVNLLDAFEASRDEIARQVLEASEGVSLLTTVQFLDGGAVKLTQITGVARQGMVTLTRSQALELYAQIKARLS